MFDSRVAVGEAFSAADDAYYSRLGALTVLPDEAELAAGGAELPDPFDGLDPDVWLQRLVDGDPQRRRSPAEVISDGEHAPISVDLIGELARIDPASVDDSSQVGLAVAWARVQNYAAARKTEAVAAFAGPAPGPKADADPRDASMFAWTSIAAALHLGEGEGTRLVDVSRDLHRFPTCRAAMLAGDVSWQKAATLTEATHALTDEQAAAVATRVLPKAAGRTPSQHAQAVRRAVDRIDPAGAAERRKKKERDIALIRTHHGDGMAELYMTLPAEQADVIWAGADAYARTAKAAGDQRSIDQLRVAAFYDWAVRHLTGQPIRDPDEMTELTPAANDDKPGDGDASEPADTGKPQPPAADASAKARVAVPHRHGRPYQVHIAIDLPTFLGLTHHPGELLGSGALIPADAVRDLLPDADLRRIITDPLTGHLLDYGTRTYRPPADLAAFVAARDVTATTPTGSQAPAASQDLDHIVRPEDGGTTSPDNLHSPTRRWHRAKTFQHWTVTQNPNHTWTWTDLRTGRTYTTAPHDYRLGP